MTDTPDLRDQIARPVCSGCDQPTRGCWCRVVEAIESELALARSGEGYEEQAVAEEIVEKLVAPLLAAKDQEIEGCRHREHLAREAFSAQQQGIDGVLRVNATLAAERDEARARADRIDREAAELDAALGEARAEVERLNLEVYAEPTDPGGA